VPPHFDEIRGLPPQNSNATASADSTEIGAFETDAKLEVGVQSIRRSLALNTTDNRDAVQALLEATHAQIAKIHDERSNDPDVRDLVDFLEELAKGLSELVTNLDRAIADPNAAPMFLGTAGKIARSLQLGLIEAVDKNRVRIWEIGACVGAAWLLSSWTGESAAEFLKILFRKK
jgi:hypothetical protein